MGDTARLFYDSDRTVLGYVGTEGAVEIGLPSPYQSYLLSQNTLAEQKDASDRLPAGKVWVMSCRTVPLTRHTNASGLTHWSWFTPIEYGPYDGVPMVIFSTVSVAPISGSGNEMAWTDPGFYRVAGDADSYGSSGFTISGIKIGKPDQVGQAVALNDSDVTGYFCIASIGSMDASRIS
jgi:hypothetical protein